MKALAALLVLIGGVASARADDPTVDLPLGDPARKEKEAPLLLDAVTDTARGDLVTPAELAVRLDPVRLLFVGESHTSMDFHDVQRRVIEELHRRGRRVMVGLEMYPYTEQAALDEWNEGTVPEKEFVERSRWYTNWSYHWNYYRDIFQAARERRIRFYGVNTPREVVTAVRKKGFANLTPEEAARIPAKIDTTSQEHRTLFRAFFGEEDALHSGMTEAQWEGMFAAQCTWDATMAYNAVRTLEKHGDDKSIMVVLIGSGHVAYGLGAERQAALWFKGRTGSIIPIPVLDDKDQPVAVRASYANFLWGLPRQRAPLYPVLGVSMAEGKGADYGKVIAVEKGSVGAKAGFRVGDRLLSMDGRPLQEKETFNRLMADKRWADAATFEVRRGDEVVKLTATFRRKAREEDEATDGGQAP
jgi:uncharacterized iron-regulated protein